MKGDSAASAGEVDPLASWRAWRDAVEALRGLQQVAAEPGTMIVLPVAAR